MILSSLEYRYEPHNGGVIRMGFLVQVKVMLRFSPNLIMD